MKKQISFLVAAAAFAGVFFTSSKAEACGNLGCGYYYTMAQVGVAPVGVAPAGMQPVGVAPVAGAPVAGGAVGVAPVGGAPLVPFGGNYGGAGGLAPWSYGRNFQAGVGGHVAPGAFGVPRPAWFGPVGRFPKLGFRAPLRRAIGLPGFTPVRQFLFGRGSFRRQNRRMALFGRRGCC